MAIPETKIKFTYEDFQRLGEEKNLEVHDGELVVMPPPLMIHARIVGDLAMTLYPFVQENGLGELYICPLDVVFTNTDIVKPDLIFVSSERAHIITEDNIRGAPDLVIEVLSPSTADRDRTFKRTLYERHGVREYWMVDPATRSITVQLLGENGFKLIGIYGEGQTLTSPTLPGFTLDLSNIF